jgi:hypothetical protein
VTDFGIGGIAAAHALHSVSQGATGHNETLATALRGAHTPLYAPPQQVRGDAPDPRDDVHALGVVWFQMLTGDLSSGTPADWMPVLEEIGLEKELIVLLGSCVSSRAERRPADAAELAERLKGLLDPPVIVPVAVPVRPPEAIPEAKLLDPPASRPMAEAIPEARLLDSPTSRRAEPFPLISPPGAPKEFVPAASQNVALVNGKYETEVRFLPEEANPANRMCSRAFRFESAPDKVYRARVTTR